MSTVVLARPSNQPVTRNYLNEAHGLRSWLFTTDHKRIALMYLASITVMFVIGGLAASAIRLELLTPEGDLLTNQTYDEMFTIHGIVMVWFFLIPSIPTTLGNFVVPMMVGARDLAFPRLNLASWYFFITAALLAIWALATGGVDTGWTMYTPFSSLFSDSQVVPIALAIFVSGISSILTGLNFIVTIHRLRAPGLTWWRLPIFIWTIYATSLIFLVATPVLGIALLLLAADHLFRLGVFDPSLGGDPLLWQHLFWFYSHPAVYIMILPGMGVVSEVIPCFARKVIFGYKFVALASLGIAVFGFLVWGHHMFVAGMSVHAALVFSLMSYLVAIPSAIKVFNWTATLYKGAISFDTPMLYALGFVGLFTIGGLSGLMLAALGVDIQVHDTYFVIAHFHYIMVGGMVMAFLGGIHYWWPKITGRMYSEWWGKVAALTIFLGFNLTFFPQFILGYEGMLRRYHSYAPEYQVLNVMSTAGATVLGVGYGLPLIYLILSLWVGRRAEANPWRATGLEWQTASPPPKENFPATPVVTVPPYQYQLIDGTPENPKVGVAGSPIDADLVATNRRDDGPIESSRGPYER